MKMPTKPSALKRGPYNIYDEQNSLVSHNNITTATDRLGVFQIQDFRLLRTVCIYIARGTIISLQKRNSLDWDGIHIDGESLNNCYCMIFHGCRYHEETLQNKPQDRWGHT